MATDDYLQLFYDYWWFFYDYFMIILWLLIIICNYKIIITIITNNVRTLQILYFSKKNKSTKNLKMEKKVAHIDSYIYYCYIIIF